MSDLYQAPTKRMIGGLTAGELLDRAQIIETNSGDFYALVGDLCLNLTDNYDMCVSDYDITIGVIELNNTQQDKLISIMKNIEEKYNQAACNV